MLWFKCPFYWAGTLMLTGALLLSGCSQSQLAVTAAKSVQNPSPKELGQKPRAGAYKVGNPYQINGIWYYPAEDPNYDSTGIASWYGEPFHGKATANGEVYDQNELTAAHQTLPMPSYVRVTNLENGRSIVVRVNDRGPFANSRIIDMSRRGAQLLGYDRQGTARVRVQAVPAPGEEGIMVARANNDVESPKVAAAPRSQVAAEALPPPPGGRGQAGQPTPTGPQAPSAVAVLGSQAAPPPDLNKQTVQQIPVKPTNLYVQAGAFSQYDNANRLRARLSSLGQARVTQINVKGVDLFRVRVGPMESVEQADQTLAQVIGAGVNEARIVVD